MIKNYNRVPYVIQPTKENLNYCHSILVFDPYGGCTHNCGYCYVDMGRAKIHNQDIHSEIHIRKNTIKLLENYLKKNYQIKYPIRMSANSDPFQPIELEKNLTFDSLKLFIKYKYPVLICTKGEISRKSIEILRRLSEINSCLVQISLPFLDQSFSDILENKNSIERRIDLIHSLKENNIPVIIRFQPIIPFFINFNGFKYLIL